MKLAARLLLSSLLASSLTTAMLPAHAEETPPAASEKGKATRTVVAENDKVQVFEIRQKPGETNTPNTSAHRVIRALKGGQLLRTYADGKTEKTEWKTGEVQIQEPGPQYSVKNIGKTEIVLYVVRMK